MKDSLPIPPYKQHHLFWMEPGLWCGWWWSISLAPQYLPSHIIVQYPFFHCVTQFVLKMERFCYDSVDNYMQKYGQEDFFFTYLCQTQTSKRLT